MSKGLILAAAALIAALLSVTAGCGRRASVRTPSPVRPEPIGWTETGVASWYGVPYDGRRASNGEIFDMHQLTAAHPTLPFETWVEVTNLENGKRVDVRINDRGPFARGRIIDLSMAAADRIGMIGPGTARVRLEVIAPSENSAESDSETGMYAVQAGAFSNRERAEKFCESLSWPDARVVEAGSKLWRVFVGKDLTKEAAEELASKMRDSGQDAIVVADQQ